MLITLSEQKNKCIAYSKVFGYSHFPGVGVAGLAVIHLVSGEERRGGVSLVAI
jgi:hypothetical protein